MPASRAVLVGFGLGLILGVPGGATAVGAIRSVDIVDGQVKTQDLGKGAVTSKKVADNTLRGRDIAESTLGTVPDAARVGGLRVVKLFVNDNESGSADLFQMADLRVRYVCQNPGDLFVYAKVVDGSPGAFTYDLFSGSSTGTAEAGEEVEIASPNIGSTTVGHLQYFDPAGHVITFDWTLRQSSTCLFAGTVVGG